MCTQQFISKAMHMQCKITMTKAEREHIVESLLKGGTILLPIGPLLPLY